MWLPRPLTDAGRARPGRQEASIFLLSLLAVGSACVTVPIDPRLQREYFGCPLGRTIADAERGLVGAGYLIRSRGEGYVQTDWQLVGDSILAASFGVTGLRTRVVAQQGQRVVYFSLFQGVDMQQRNILLGGTATQSKEIAWNPITTAQATDQQSRGILSGVRFAVCGDGSLPWDRPEEAERLKPKRKRKPVAPPPPVEEVEVEVATSTTPVSADTLRSW